MSVSTYNQGHVFIAIQKVAYRYGGAKHKVRLLYLGRKWKVTVKKSTFIEASKSIFG